MEGVFLRYGEPDSELLSTLTLADAARYATEGFFPAGSMGPKIEAAVEFIRNGGKRALITSIEAIEDAVEGKSGTEIVR
ncbi:MAG: hypothetical protein ABSC19_03700 [Syntrophorhabdales bacterium]